MTAFFITPEREAALGREVTGWLGTPFIDGIGSRARKGTAADCVSWIASALQAVGAIGAVPWPKRYVSATGGPDMLATLLDTLSRVQRLQVVAQPTVLMFGDMLVGTTGRARHHAALYVGYNRIVHCWDGRVREGNVRDTMLAKHLHSVWRAYD